jgi:hypothetical protein
MLRLRHRVITLAALLLIAPAALAWGPEGHGIIADIAQRHLDPAAARAVAQLLALQGDHHLDQVSSWPDQIRKDHPETGPWHYVDIPLRAPEYSRRRDCPQGHCVVVKLPHYVRVLADRSASPRVRLEALKWVVHLVGDIHQPLHDTDHDDRGGNDVKLVYFGHPTNLHRMWDTNILEHALHLRMGPHYTFDHQATRRIAGHLDAQITPAERAAWSPAAPLAHIDAEAVAWADAAHMLAQTTAYGALPSHRGPHWSAPYQARAWPVVRGQLQRAGVRLADVLNAALR